MSKIPYKFNPFGKSEGGVDLTKGLDFYCPFDNDWNEVIHNLEGQTFGTYYFGMGNDSSKETMGNFLDGHCTSSNTTKALKIKSAHRLLQYGTNNFSISFWVRAPEWENYAQNCIFSKKYTDTYKGFVLYRDGNNPKKLTMRVGTGTSTQYDVVTNTDFQSSEWVHWCYVRKDHVGYWFRNGILDNYGTDLGDITNTDDVYFGYNATWATNGVYKLKSFRIYNRDLDINEIVALSKEFNVKYYLTLTSSQMSQNFNFYPIKNESKFIGYSCYSKPQFEILSGSLPNTITFNTSTGEFYGKSVLGQSASATLTIKLYGNNIVEPKEMTAKIYLMSEADLYMRAQTFNFVTEAESRSKIQITVDPDDTLFMEWDTKPMIGQAYVSGISDSNEKFINFNGNANQSSTITKRIEIYSTYHPTHIFPNITVNISLNQITVNDKELDFYVDDGAWSYQIKYATQNSITPVYTLSGTLPTGITFDSSTGTFSYDGTATTPTSGTVQVTVSSSSGFSAPGTGNFTLKLNAGSAPIPSGVWLYCPCSDASTFECEDENVRMTSYYPTFYSAQDEGRACFTPTMVGRVLQFNPTSNFPAGNASISTSYWMKCKADTNFSTGHGNTIFVYGGGSGQRAWRNALLSTTGGTSTSSWTGAFISNDAFNGTPAGTMIVGTSDDAKIYENGEDYTWHLYTKTWDGTNLKFYIDDTLVCHRQCTGQFNLRTGYNAFTIGLPNDSNSSGGWSAYNATTPTYFISDLRLWKRALTAAEVANLYINTRV